MGWDGGVEMKEQKLRRLLQGRAATFIATNLP
jgi:hypothetical protein